MEIGQQISNCREKNNLSQKKLAQKMNTSIQTISDWENNVSCPNVQELVKLSKLFEVSIEQLVKGKTLETELTIEEKKDAKRFKVYQVLICFIFIFTIVIVILFIFRGFTDKYLLIFYGVLSLVSIFLSLQIQKIRKKYNIKTSKELLAFYKGEKPNISDRKAE